MRTKEDSRSILDMNIHQICVFDEFGCYNCHTFRQIVNVANDNDVLGNQRKIL